MESAIVTFFSCGGDKTLGSGVTSGASFLFGAVEGSFLFLFDGSLGGVSSVAKICARCLARSVGDLRFSLSTKFWTILWLFTTRDCWRLRRYIPLWLKNFGFDHTSSIAPEEKTTLPSWISLSIKPNKISLLGNENQISQHTL